jgi:hypothetical protein
MHTEDDSFSLSYWNYHKKENRAFLEAFGIMHLDGNLNNAAASRITYRARDASTTGGVTYYAENLRYLSAASNPREQLPDQ